MLNNNLIYITNQINIYLYGTNCKATTKEDAPGRRVLGGDTVLRRLSKEVTLIYVDGLFSCKKNL